MAQKIRAGMHLKSVVTKAIKGDRKALEELLFLKQKDILYYAISVSSLHEGKDIAQESMIKIAKNISQLEDADKFASWSCSVVRNTAFETLRKKQRMPINEEVDLSALEDSEETEDYLPLDCVEDSEKRKKLMEIIEGLPRNYREALFLFYYQDLTYREVASVLNITEDKVRNDLARARRTLKKTIESKSSSTLLFFKAAGVSAGTFFMEAFQQDISDKIKPEAMAGVWAMVQGKLAVLNGVQVSAPSASTTGTLSFVVPAALVTAVLTTGAVLGIAMQNFPDEERVSSYDAPAYEEQISPEAPSAPVEVPIITLADMIGTENEQELLSFEESTVNVSEVNAFVERIGAHKRNQTSYLDDEADILYSLEKQNKRLLIAAHVNSGNLCQVVHRFNDKNEVIPDMLEVSFWFE